MGEVIVSQVLELQLIGRTLQACGISGRNHRVSQLPDLTHGVLKGTVAVDHDFHMLAGGLQDALLNVLHQILALTGEELDLVFGSLVGAQEAVLLIAAAAVDGSGHDIVQTANTLRTGSLEQALGTLAGMNIAVDDVFGVVQDGAAVIGKDDLHIGAALADQTLVVFHVVNTGKGVLLVAEELTVFLKTQHILVGIYALFIQGIQTYQMVADFVRGVAEHQDHLLGALGDAAQANGETVAAEDGENNTHGLAAKLFLDVCGDIINGAVVALGAGHDGLGHGDNITVADCKTVVRSGFQHGSGDDLSQVIALADDGGANASGNSTDHSAHIGTLPNKKFMQRI